MYFPDEWDYQASTAHEEMEGLKRQNEDLRLTVSQLQEQMTFLVKQQGDLRSELDKVSKACQATTGMSVVDRDRVKELNMTRRLSLPPELLRMIFLECLPAKGEAALKINEAPLIFGRVCRLWRQVAWSTQELWNTLHITIPALDYNPSEWRSSKWKSYTNAIRSWRYRSRQLPLSISLVDENSLYWCLSHDVRMEMIREVIEEISTACRRWKNIRLELPADAIKYHLHVQPLELPILETLEIRVSNPDLTTAQIEGINVPGEDFDAGFHPIVFSPSLQSLYLSDVSIPGSFVWGHQPGFTDRQWSNLRDLSIGEEYPVYKFSSSLTGFQALVILRHLANAGTRLQSCRMSLRKELPGGDQVQLHSLRELIITFARGPSGEADDIDDEVADNDLHLFFSALICPSLRAFEYKAFGKTHFPFLLLLQQAHTLENLRLYVFQNSIHASISPLLSSTIPCVKELHLSTALTRGLIQDSEEGINLPELRTLVLDCTAPMDRRRAYSAYVGHVFAPEPTFRRIVERKRYSDLQGRIKLVRQLCGTEQAQLQEVRFRLNERLRDAALDELGPLIECGLRITFKKDQFDVLPPVGPLPSLTDGVWCSSDDI